MTPEERLWILLVQSGVKIMPRMDAEAILKEVRLEATRQAYEDAARICNQRARSATSEGDKSSFYEAEECAESIRAKMKEYDNET